MRKRFYPLALVVAIAMMTVALPMVASAGTADADSMEVMYNLAAEEPSGGGGGGTTEETADYIVHIPSNIALNYEQDILITCTTLDIPADKRLVVYIDSARTFDFGTFWLTTGDGSTEAQKIPCGIIRGSSSDLSSPPNDVLSGLSGDEVVATFQSTSNGGADTYGWLRFLPSEDTSGKVPGEYSGVCYFKIALEPN